MYHRRFLGILRTCWPEESITNMLLVNLSDRSLKPLIMTYINLIYVDFSILIHVLIILVFWHCAMDRHPLKNKWTSLVVQWLRHRFNPWSGKIPYAMEQLSPCPTTTEPACHNYWSPSTLEPTCHNYWAHVLQLQKPTPRARAPQQEKPPQWEALSLHLKKARVQQWRSNAAKNKNKFLFS